METEEEEEKKKEEKEEEEEEKEEEEKEGKGGVKCPALGSRRLLIASRNALGAHDLTIRWTRRGWRDDIHLTRFLPKLGDVSHEAAKLDYDRQRFCL